jgi:hypothetical protein
MAAVTNLSGRAATALVAAALVSLLCAAGGRHPADVDLQRNFRQHQLEFEALLADLKADPQLEMITQSELRLLGPRTPPPRRDRQKASVGIGFVGDFGPWVSPR